MERFAEISLKNAIASQLMELNQANAQFYALLNRVGSICERQDKVNDQRLEDLRLDMKDRIRVLSGNVDVLYQTLDAKIGMVVSHLSHFEQKGISSRVDELARKTR